MHIPGELQSSTFVPYVTAILFNSNTAEPHGKRANILNTIHYPVESRQGALTDVLNSKKQSQQGFGKPNKSGSKNIATCRA